MSQYDIAAALEAMFLPRQPVHGEEFSIDGREYSLIHWHDGWVWRDEKEVNDSTEYGHGPWAEAWEEQRDAFRDRRERA